MNQNVSVLAVSENEYRVSGTCVSLEDITKTVVVDGETYINRRYEEVTHNLDDMWENKEVYNRWHCVEIDEFSHWGVPLIKFWNYSNASDFIYTGYYKSENSYVSILQTLDHLGCLPVKIYCGRGSQMPYNIFGDIEVILYGYGFNNTVSTFLKYQEILKLNIPDCMIVGIHYFRERLYFQDGWQTFDEKRKTELLINYINKIETI